MLASPKRRRILFLSYFASIIVAIVIAFILAGAELLEDNQYWFDGNAALISSIFLAGSFSLVGLLMLIFIRGSLESVKKSAITLSIALAIFLGFMIIYIIMGQGFENWNIINIGIIIMVSIITYRFSTHRSDLIIPAPEALLTSSKTSYKLLKGRVYLIEENRPHFGFEVFSDVLRRRCYDCENDESFMCESLDCYSCGLPCPCRECTQYPGRNQGLIVTRRYPFEIRAEHFIQTTPIIWLTSLPGKDNMDPAKLSLLTDMIVNFVEKSHNGVVLVEGIEYLMTANDFSKVLRAIDQWSEAVMSQSSRLIISLNPEAFDPRELALIERNRELVKPEDYATMEKIFAYSS